MARNDDRNSSLSEIACQQNRSIVSLLVDIQRNTMTTHNRALGFLERLECLQLPHHLDGQKTSITVNRENIDATKDCHYVALSYTWEGSRHERKAKGLYHVQEHHGPEFKPSDVRDCVFDRIFNYMRTIGVNLLWIDRHGINQDSNDCKNPTCTTHEACTQKREGVAVMDLVYKLSRYPVGLLGRPIKSAWELERLANLLQGKLTSGSGANIQLSRETNLHKARTTLEVLRRITGDDWWRRGWIFQENYKGDIKMRLLIKYSGKLERLKRRYQETRSYYGTPIFGSVPGELCIRSVDLFEETTRLCLAYSSATAKSDKKMERIISVLLQRAGKYKLLLKPSESMTPRIITEINTRRMSEYWDIPAIVANCCGYAIRLNTKRLEQNGASLSLSILAQCLLNGEVLDNGRPTNPKASKLTVSRYLKDAIFSEFNSNRRQHNLTFNKSCRFFNVSLTKSGTQTRGHLWKLHKVLDTRGWPSQGAWVDDLHGKLKPLQRRRLAYLARRLERDNHGSLSKNIREHLEHDADLAGVAEHSLSFTKRYLNTMAAEVADAIAHGGSLILGCLWNPDVADKHSPYSAVFVWDSGDTRPQTSDESHMDEIFVFTASRPKDDGSKEFDLNDIDRHVSFEVTVDGFISGRSGWLPSLRIRRWLPGMCFFKDVPRGDVMFPWPRELEGITP